MINIHVQNMYVHTRIVFVCSDISVNALCPERQITHTQIKKIFGCTESRTWIAGVIIQRYIHCATNTYSLLSLS